MPACSRQRNPRGVEVVFTEEDHKYTSVIDGRELVYVSATQFIHRFFPVFDADGKVAERCAAKSGKTVDEIHAEWAENCKIACELGTKIHETCEDTLLGRNLRNSPSNENERLLMASAVAMSREILDGMDIVGVEQIVFDERLGIAGTIDLLARSKKDGALWILDHKTNKSIDMENPFGNFALPPIQHVPDLNYYHYSLQLNLYDRLLHEAGYCPKDEKIKKAILHIQPNGHKTYVLKDMSEEIDRLLAVGAIPNQR